MKLTIRSAIMGAALSLIAGAAFAQASDSATGHGSVKIITPIALSENQALNFGTIVKPSASVTATIADTAAGATGGTATRVSDSANAPTSGIFKVTGENGYAFSITVPASMSLSNGSATIPVTLTASNTSGTIGTTNSSTAGEAYYYVGGSMSLDGSTAVGAYAGTFTTSVQYN